MQFYNQNTDRLISHTTLIDKYGTDQAIPQLGIFELSFQPDYIPVGYNRVHNNIYYPVQSYMFMKFKAERALEDAGYSPEQIIELLDNE